ncbi:MAG: oligosaccharide flippase family protein [Bacteroidaceae bacterium]|nr:oligosaccharide flippase family protein [Bacteroidaceae bacterium]
MSKKENESRSDSYGHVLKYTSLFGGVQVLKIMVDVVRNKLAAMLLHREGMGLNAQYMNSAEVAGSVTNFGLGIASVQQLSELYEKGNAEELRRFVGVVRTWSLWSSVIGMLVCFLLSLLASSWYFPNSFPAPSDIALLCLFVGALPIEEGECSILKGTRRLGSMAGVESSVALATLLLTIPVYYLMGLRGVVLALALVGWAKVALHMTVTLRLFPYRVFPFSAHVLRAGRPLLRRGIPFMLAAVLGSLTTMALFRYCLDGNPREIGLYKSIFNLMVTYAGMVFIAIGNDFFPRLSSVNHDRRRMNHAINQQIDVSVLLITPLLIGLVVVMPWIIRLLYSSEFLPGVAMGQCAALYMFFQAVTKPVAYTSLARGDSGVFLAMEAVYNAVFLGLMYYAYHHYSLVGAGVALSLAALFDMLMICITYSRLYRLSIRRSTLRVIAVQATLLFAVIVACMPLITWVKYVVALPAFALSTAFSWRTLAADVHFSGALRDKINKLRSR